MAKHIDTVGILWMVYGGLQLAIALLLGLGLFGLGGALGMAGASGGDDELAVMGGIYALMGPLIGVMMGFFAAIDIAAGIGIRRRTKWGRILGFVAAILSIGSIPLGTALGIFSFVVLLDKDAALEFEQPPLGA